MQPAAPCAQQSGSLWLRQSAGAGEDPTTSGQLGVPSARLSGNQWLGQPAGAGDPGAGAPPDTAAARQQGWQPSLAQHAGQRPRAPQHFVGHLPEAPPSHWPPGNFITPATAAALKAAKGEQKRSVRGAQGKKQFKIVNPYTHEDVSQAQAKRNESASTARDCAGCGHAKAADQGKESPEDGKWYCSECWSSFSSAGNPASGATSPQQGGVPNPGRRRRCNWCGDWKRSDSGYADADGQSWYCCECWEVFNIQAQSSHGVGGYARGGGAAGSSCGSACGGMAAPAKQSLYAASTSPGLARPSHNGPDTQRQQGSRQCVHCREPRDPALGAEDNDGRWSCFDCWTRQLGQQKCDYGRPR